MKLTFLKLPGMAHWNPSLALALKRVCRCFLVVLVVTKIRKFVPRGRGGVVDIIRRRANASASGMLGVVEGVFFFPPLRLFCLDERSKEAIETAWWVQVVWWVEDGGGKRYSVRNVPVEFGRCIRFLPRGYVEISAGVTRRRRSPTLFVSTVIICSFRQ